MSTIRKTCTTMVHQCPRSMTWWGLDIHLSFSSRGSVVSAPAHMSRNFWKKKGKERKQSNGDGKSGRDTSLVITSFIFDWTSTWWSSQGWEGHQWHFNFFAHVFRLQAMEIPSQATGGVNTTLTSHACTRAIFLVCVAQVFTALFAMIRCAQSLKNNHHTSHMPCSVQFLKHFPQLRRRIPRLPLPCFSLQIGQRPGWFAERFPLAVLAGLWTFQRATIQLHDCFTMEGSTKEELLERVLHGRRRCDTSGKRRALQRRQRGGTGCAGERKENMRKGWREGQGREEEGDGRRKGRRGGREGRRRSGGEEEGWGKGRGRERGRKGRGRGRGRGREGGREGRGGRRRGERGEERRGGRGRGRGRGREHLHFGMFVARFFVCVFLAPSDGNRFQSSAPRFRSAERLTERKTQVMPHTARHAPHFPPQNCFGEDHTRTSIACAVTQLCSRVENKERVWDFLRVTMVVSRAR